MGLPGYVGEMAFLRLWSSVIVTEKCFEVRAMVVFNLRKAEGIISMPHQHFTQAERFLISPHLRRQIPYRIADDSGTIFSPAGGFRSAQLAYLRQTYKSLNLGFSVNNTFSLLQR